LFPYGPDKNIVDLLRFVGENKSLCPKIIKTSLKMNEMTVSITESLPNGIIRRLRTIIVRPAIAALPVSLVTLNLNNLFIRSLSPHYTTYA
jgi:hypothetical protein